MDLNIWDFLESKHPRPYLCTEYGLILIFCDIYLLGTVKKLIIQILVYKFFMPHFFVLLEWYPPYTNIFHPFVCFLLKKTFLLSRAEVTRVVEIISMQHQTLTILRNLWGTISKNGFSGWGLIMCISIFVFFKN